MSKVRVQRRKSNGQFFHAATYQVSNINKKGLRCLGFNGHYFVPFNRIVPSSATGNASATVFKIRHCEYGYSWWW